MQKAPRPKCLPGTVTRVDCGCGRLYVAVTFNEGLPFEVFAWLGKSGGCAACQTEALTRGISLGLRYGVPVEEYIKGLKGIQCPSPVPFPAEDAVMSCPDGIAKVMEEQVKNSRVVQVNSEECPVLTEVSRGLEELIREKRG